MLLDLSSKIWPVFDGEAVSPKARQRNGNKMFRYWVPILLVMGVTVNAFWGDHNISTDEDTSTGRNVLNETSKNGQCRQTIILQCVSSRLPPLYFLITAKCLFIAFASFTEVFQFLNVNKKNKKCTTIINVEKLFKCIETFYILHDTFTSQVAYQWLPYNSTSLQISDEKTQEYS